MDDDPRLSIGGNRPPETMEPEDQATRLARIDPERLVILPTEDLAPLFQLQYAALVERSAEFTAGILRWREAHKNGAVPIANDAENHQLAEWINQLRDFAGPDGEVQETRKRVKQCVLEASRAIDGFFNGLSDPIDSAIGPAKHALVGTLQHAQTSYLIAKARREQEERDRIAREAAAEAQRKADEAARIARESAAPEEVEQATEAALEAEERAAVIAQDAAAPIQTFGRSRTPLGHSVGLRGEWDAKVTDIKALCAAIARGDAPATFVTPDMSAIRRAVRNKAMPLRKCDGLEIEETFAASRRGA